MKTQNKCRAEKIKELLKYHVVDTTALLTSSTPVYAAMEVGVVGMSDQVSLGSRLAAAGLSYGGIALAFSRGRDISRKIFGINDSTRERTQTLHDAVYAAVFNGVTTPPLYMAMGADIKQAIFGGISSAALSVPMGPILGYSVDVARDMTGLKKCERASYPKLIKDQVSSVKKGLAALLLAGSLALTAGAYTLIPNEKNASVHLQQVIESKNK